MATINPSPSDLGRVNAILSGRAARYGVRGFAGPLSVKSVVRGKAVWTAAAGRFEIGPGTALLINDEEPYSIEIDALQPVETFCVFFARGFVEDAYRAAISGSAALLDAPPAPRVTFDERLQFDAELLGGLSAARTAMRDGLPLEEPLTALATQLVRAHCDVDARAARLPSLRASTREELRRRLGIATAFLHASVARPVTSADAASAACLSPFHFHRLFTAFHGETPHRYLTRLRLDRACALLHGSDAPVADVAADCGFESVGSFTTRFTRRFGVPPARFRRIREVAAAAAR